MSKRAVDVRLTTHDQKDYSTGGVSPAVRDHAPMHHVATESSRWAASVNAYDHCKYTHRRNRRRATIMNKSAIVTGSGRASGTLCGVIEVANTRRPPPAVNDNISARGGANDDSQKPTAAAASTEHHRYRHNFQRVPLVWGASHELPLEYGPDT